MAAFWLGLALPGYALLFRFDRAALEGGALAALARSYLISFLLLTPVSVLGYLFHWPLAVFSGAYLALLALGAASLIASRKRLPRPTRPSLIAALSGSILLVDLVLGARAGTHLGGDAGYHIARIRLLYELGLNSWDPLVPGHRFDAIYHTNLYHALIASSAQLARVDPADAWLEVWPFAKLLSAAAAYQLGLIVFGRRWLAWVVALATTLFYTSFSILPFPNTLAPTALLALGMGACIEALCKRPSYRPALFLAASALMLAQMHMLNALFLALVAAPPLALGCLYRLLRKRPGVLQLTAALLACGASLPWLGVTAWPRLQAYREHHARPAAASENEAAAAPAETDVIAKGTYKAHMFERLPNGEYIMDPDNLAGSNERNALGVYALLLGLLVEPRRRELWMVVGLVATTCAWLLIPPLCTLLLTTIGAPWAVGRIGNVFAVALWLLVPSAPLMAAERLRDWRAARVLVDLAALCLTVASARELGVAGKPWTLTEYAEEAADFQARRDSNTIAARRAFYAANLPAGASVMAHTRWDYNLPMHYRCHIFALSRGRGFRGVSDMYWRRKDTDEFFSARTSGERRLEILRHWGLRYVYTSRSYARVMVRTMQGHAFIHGTSRFGAIVWVDP